MLQKNDTYDVYMENINIKMFGLNCDLMVNIYEHMSHCSACELL